MLKSLPFHLRNMAGLHISDKASSPSKNFVDQIFSSKDLCPIGRLLISSSVDIWWYIMIFWCCQNVFCLMDEIQISWSCKESKPWPSALLPTAHSYLCRCSAPAPHEQASQISNVARPPLWPNSEPFDPWEIRLANFLSQTSSWIICVVLRSSPSWAFKAWASFRASSGYKMIYDTKFSFGYRKLHCKPGCSGSHPML